MMAMLKLCGNRGNNLIMATYTTCKQSLSSTRWSKTNTRETRRVSILLIWCTLTPTRLSATIQKTLRSNSTQNINVHTVERKQPLSVYMPPRVATSPIGDLKERRRAAAAGKTWENIRRFQQGGGSETQASQKPFKWNWTAESSWTHRVKPTSLDAFHHWLRWIWTIGGAISMCNLNERSECILYNFLYILYICNIKIKHPFVPIQMQYNKSY